MDTSADELILEGMVFFGHHGNLAAERRLGGEVFVDLRVRMAIAEAARTDRLSGTLDYLRVHDLVKGIVERRRFALLETLAEKIAQGVLKLPGVESVRVRVGKHPRLPGRFETFAVEIERATGRRRR